MRTLGIGVSAVFLFARLVLGPAEAETQVRVGRAFAGVFDFVPVDVGLSQGLFKKHGLAIDATDFAGSAKLQQALAAGAIDIGLGSGVELAFVARGAPVEAIAAFMGPPADLTLIVRNEPGVRTVADLKGKRVSVSTVSSLTEWLVREISRQETWGPDGITTVPLGDRPAQISALRTKQTDGMAIDFVGGTVLERQGIGRILLHFDKVVPDFITHATFAREGFIKEHGDAVRAFLAAWFETIVFMRQHKAEAVRIAAAAMNEPEDIVSADYDLTMPAFSDTGRFEAKPLAVLRRSFVEMGLLPSEPDMKTLYSERFLPNSGS